MPAIVLWNTVGITSELMQRASKDAAVWATVMLKNCSTQLEPLAKKAIPRMSSKLDSMLPTSDVLKMGISYFIKAWTETMSSTALLDWVNQYKVFVKE